MRPPPAPNSRPTRRHRRLRPARGTDRSRRWAMDGPRNVPRRPRTTNRALILGADSPSGCAMHHHVVPASLLLLGIGLLAGCGQKGPLYLPTRPASSAPADSPPPPATSVAKPAAAATAAIPAAATSGG
ncbi:MAG: LPS translocon maturation chaperone LptM [Rhodanobacteraceae bacterium]